MPRKTPKRPYRTRAQVLAAAGRPIAPPRNNAPKRVRPLEQLVRIFAARSVLPESERKVFDLVMAERAQSVRQMAAEVGVSLRRVHTALNYLEERGYIRCLLDLGGRRQAYLLNE